VPGLTEMAIGIASVLAGDNAPDPLPVQLRGQTIDQAAYFVRAVIRECADADIHLSKVVVDPDLHRWLTRFDAEPLQCALNGKGLRGEVLFTRKA
jgi:hypothetical protein